MEVGRWGGTGGSKSNAGASITAWTIFVRDIEGHQHEVIFPHGRQMGISGCCPVHVIKVIMCIPVEMGYQMS